MQINRSIALHSKCRQKSYIKEGRRVRLGVEISENEKWRGGQDSSRRGYMRPSSVWKENRWVCYTQTYERTHPRRHTHSKRRDEWRNDVKRLQPWRSPSTSPPPPSSHCSPALPLVYCCVCPQANLSRDCPLACEGESSESGSVLY